MEFDEIDDTVKDGIGEICNMLAGGGRARFRICGELWLVVPAVITGRITDCMCRLLNSNSTTGTDSRMPALK